MNERMTQVQSSTVKVMDTIVLEVQKMDAFQKYHFVNKIKNFILSPPDTNKPLTATEFRSQLILEKLMDEGIIDENYKITSDGASS